jgi:hypothetical protein
MNKIQIMKRIQENLHNQETKIEETTHQAFLDVMLVN